MKIISADKNHREEWLRMRTTLWPDCPPEDSSVEISAILAGTKLSAFLALDDDGDVIGFVEVSTRDYVDGAVTSPVGFVEGIFVDVRHRNTGVGSALIRAAEAWARERGCTELGSDTQIGNSGSIAFHQAAGFREMERQIIFLKKLPHASGPDS